MLALALRARRSQPDQRRADLPGRGDRGRPGRAASLPACWPPSAGSLLLNYYFTPPIHQFTIAGGEQRPRARACSSWWRCWSARSWTSPPGAPGRRRRPAPSPSCWPPRPAACCAASAPSSAVLDRVREAFGMDSVTLLERGDRRQPPAGCCTGARNGRWRTAGAAPRRPSPDDADVEVPVTSGLRRWSCAAAPLAAADRRVLGAFAAYAAVAPGSAAPVRRGRGGQADRRGRPDAHCAARRGQPRPAHPLARPRRR